MSELQKVLGTELLVSGNVKFNDYSESIELTAREFGIPNPVNESKIIITQLEEPPKVA